MASPCCAATGRFRCNPGPRSSPLLRLTFESLLGRTVPGSRKLKADLRSEGLPFSDGDGFKSSTLRFEKAPSTCHTLAHAVEFPIPARRYIHCIPNHLRAAVRPSSDSPAGGTARGRTGHLNDLCRPWVFSSPFSWAVPSCVSRRPARDGRGTTLERH
jgi:hypothetical protein